MDKFIYRNKDLEVRSCGERLLLEGEHTTAEIIKWSNDKFESCYVLAYWVKSSEGFDLHFLGSRPFDGIDFFTFMKLAQLGQDELDKYFYQLKNNQENT